MTAVADLARKLAVSRGTVTNRVQRLQDAQMIVGYTVRLKPDAEPERIRAWMGIAVEGNQSRAVIASLLGEPGVSALHDTNGRWDLLAELQTDSMSGLSQVLERIRRSRAFAVPRPAFTWPATAEGRRAVRQTGRYRFCSDSR